MLGQIAYLIPYMSFTLWKSNYGTLRIKHGTGLAYATRPYHALSNPDNLLIGSKINASSMIEAGYEIKLSSHWALEAGASLSHTSNGRIIAPNQGLNSYSGYGSVIYRYSRMKNAAPSPDSSMRNGTPKRWRYRLAGLIGMYDYERSNKALILNRQISAMVFYQAGTRFRPGLGIEVSRLAEKPNTSIYAEGEVLFGHLVTRYGLGGYLSGKNEEGRIYEKVGIAWYPFHLVNQVPEKFSIGASIKAHGFRAAHIELSGSYLF